MFKQCDSGILLVFEVTVSMLAMFQYPSRVGTGCMLLLEPLPLGRTPTCMEQPALAVEHMWWERKKSQHLPIPLQVSELTEYCYTSKYFS